MKMLTSEYLKSILHYDHDTGIFTWLQTNSPRVKIGDIAGSLSKEYIVIKINNKHYLAHRLAFLYMTGEWPKNEVDHINRIKNNNQWDNLRDVDRSINIRNRVHKGNGLYIRKNINNQFYVMVNLGVFDCEKDAIIAGTNALNFKSKYRIKE